MKKPKAKTWSNILKLLIVIYTFYQYHHQSTIALRPLTADECKGLLFVAIAGFFILLPIDASIFVKNFMSFKNHVESKDIQQ